MGCKATRRKELESLLGLLQHAAKIVSPGRRFVRRIIQALTSVREHDHYVRLGAEIQSDLWLHKFFDRCNGVGNLPTPGMESVHILSDASGSWINSGSNGGGMKGHRTGTLPLRSCYP